MPKKRHDSQGRADAALRSGVPDEDVSRREFLQEAAGGVAVAGTVGLSTLESRSAEARAEEPPLVSVTLKVNAKLHELKLETRVTLLDALREHLGLTGTTKGCDHGQCGACTVLIDGRRI